MWENTLWYDDVRVEPASLNEMLLSRDFSFCSAVNTDSSSKRYVVVFILRSGLGQRSNLIQLKWPYVKVRSHFTNMIRIRGTQLTFQGVEEVHTVCVNWPVGRVRGNF